MKKKQDSYEISYEKKSFVTCSYERFWSGSYELWCM